MTGVSLLLSWGLVKLDKVIQNQIDARAEMVLINAKLDEAHASCEFVKGQNSERTRFNHDFALRLIRLENETFK